MTESRFRRFWRWLMAQPGYAIVLICTMASVTIWLAVIALLDVASTEKLPAPPEPVEYIMDADVYWLVDPRYVSVRGSNTATYRYGWRGIGGDTGWWTFDGPALRNFHPCRTWDLWKISTAAGPLIDCQTGSGYGLLASFAIASDGGVWATERMQALVLAWSVPIAGIFTGMPLGIYFVVLRLLRPKRLFLLYFLATTAALLCVYWLIVRYGVLVWVLLLFCSTVTCS